MSFENYPWAVVTRRVALDNLNRTESILPCLNYSPHRDCGRQDPKPTAWPVPDEWLAASIKRPSVSKNAYRHLLRM